MPTSELVSRDCSAHDRERLRPRDRSQLCSPSAAAERSTASTRGSARSIFVTVMMRPLTYGRCAKSSSTTSRESLRPSATWKSSSKTNDHHGVVVAIAYRADVAPLRRRGQTHCLDLDALAVVGRDVPTGLAETGPRPAVVRVHDRLGDVPDGVVVRPDDVAPTELAHHCCPIGEHLDRRASTWVVAHLVLLRLRKRRTAVPAAALGVGAGGATGPAPGGGLVTEAPSGSGSSPGST